MRVLVVALSVLWAPLAWTQEWRGSVAIEYRGYTQTVLDTDQHTGYTSIVVEPEYYRSWDAGRQAVTFRPFYRLDQFDEQRTHGDVRELFWLYAGTSVDWRVGIRKVFWGVTESQHLVDVINQTDLVEDPDGEDKLGQPMVSASVPSDMGTFELFVLPYFLERTFAGEEGRLRTIPRVETGEDALYEAGERRRHVDWALRWTRTYGGWDVGLSHFYGTNREPVLVPGVNRRGEAVLFPFYELMHQTGLDVQGAQGSWLWKLEAIRRRSDRDRYWAGTAGAEYTNYGVFGSAVDVGWLLEYLYDSRGRQATTTFEDDVMIGLRLSFNDPATTELLMASIVDRDTSARVHSVEASRRLTDHFRLTLEARLFAGQEPDDPAYSVRHDDYVQLGLAYYF